MLSINKKHQRVSLSLKIDECLTRGATLEVQVVEPMKLLEEMTASGCVHVDNLYQPVNSQTWCNEPGHLPRSPRHGSEAVS